MVCVSTVRGRLLTRTVEPSPVLVERVRLSEIVAGRRPATTPIGAALPPGVDVRQTRAVDYGDGCVTLATGETLTADAVVVGTGSRGRLPEAVGAHAEPPAHVASEGGALFRLEDPALPAALASSPGGPVTVVGGGTSGVEVAAELAEAGFAVTLVAPALLPTLSPAAARYAQHTLERLAVRWRQGRAHVAENGLAVSDGTGAVPPAGVVIWATGIDVVVPGERGQVAVDPFLRQPGTRSVFIAGDAAAVRGADGDLLRGACASAMPMGMHVANNIHRLLAGRALAPWSFRFLLVCVSLGRHAAMVQLVDAADRPTRLVTGRLAVWTKELICRGTIALPLWEARTGVRLYRWPQGPLAPALAAPSPAPPVAPRVAPPPGAAGRLESP